MVTEVESWPSPQRVWQRLNVVLAATFFVIVTYGLLVVVFGTAVLPVQTDADVASTRLQSAEKAARAELMAFYGIDHAHVDEGLAKVQSGATGTFAQQLASSVSAVRQTAVAGNVSAQASIVQMASVMASASEVVLIAAVDTTMRGTTTASAHEPGCPAGAKCERLRLRLSLVAVAGSWKLSDIGEVG